MNYIITSDWHLRSNRPRCRLDDDWIKTQRDILAQIAIYAKEYSADVIVIGDIFHSTIETTNEILGLVQELALRLDNELGKSLYVLAGNHDLPMHNLDNIHRSAFKNLLFSKNVYPLDEIIINNENVSAANFGEDDDGETSIVFKHILCFPENEKIPPSDKIVKPSELFKQLPLAKYIFTGDYHKQFVYKNSKGKMLMNPGCLIRQAADLIDYEPSILLVNFDTKDVTYKSLPIIDNENLVTDEYLEKEELRNIRIEAFIERIQENKQITFDFIENVHNTIKNNKIDAHIKNTILELLENI